MELDRKLKPKKIIIASIGDAAKKWPNSRSRAFHIKGFEGSYYFMLKDPERVKHKLIRSRVECLKFIEHNGFITKTNLTIKSNMEIVPMTIKEFHDMASKRYGELKDHLDFESLLEPYRHWDLRGRH